MSGPMDAVVREMLSAHCSLLAETQELLKTFGDRAADYLTSDHIFVLAVQAGCAIDSTAFADGKLKWHTKWPVGVYVKDGQYVITISKGFT